VPDPTYPLVFDGHNDVLLRLYRKGRPGAESMFLEGCDGGHLDLPRMRAGGFGGGLFAVYVPSSVGGADPDGLMTQPRYDIPLAPTIDAKSALPVANAMAALLFRIERASDGAVKVCRSAAEIRNCFASGILATVMHMEGAEAIDADLDALEVLAQAGLRSLGPVWSRPTIFGYGVPFRYPGTPDIGPGLTDTGKALVKACNDHKVAIDLSHINEKGFWDVADLTDAPLIASHSNAHAICPHARNLTDDQLKAIGESGGIAGLNFATCFIRPDGRRNADTSFDTMLAHLDHMIETAGVDHVGFGSDFDGAQVPAGIGDVAGLPALQEAMRRHGYDEATMRKLCHENWIGVLERTWGS
jgi:membrane dipeptidase